MNVTLKQIGYWNGGMGWRSKYIWPQELVTRPTRQPRDVLASYLSKGLPALRWAGYSACRICKKTLGSTCVTDGTWMWPEKLEHYVEKHHVVLPDEFVAFAMGHGGRIPISSFDEDETKIHGDDSFWIGWCEEHRDTSRDPDCNCKAYKLPKSSGKGTMTAEVVSDLFMGVELQDCIVQRLFVPNAKILKHESLKQVIDNINGKLLLFSAEVVEGYKLIVADSVDYVAKSVLVFKDGKPFVFCNSRAVCVTADLRVSEIRFCPSLEITEFGS